MMSNVHRPQSGSKDTYENGTGINSDVDLNKNPGITGDSPSSGLLLDKMSNSDKPETCQHECIMLNSDCDNKYGTDNNINAHCLVRGHDESQPLKSTEINTSHNVPEPVLHVDVVLQNGDNKCTSKICDNKSSDTQPAEHVKNVKTSSKQCAYRIFVLGVMLLANILNYIDRSTIAGNSDCNYIK